MSGLNFIWNHLSLGFSTTIGRHETRLFHIANLLPMRSLRQDRFGNCVRSSSAIVFCFFLTMLYSWGYWSHRDLLPNHMFFQNFTWDSSFIMMVLNLRKFHLTFIKFAQKYESPLFHWTCTSALVPRYLLRMICCHIPSVVNIWYSYLLSKAIFFSSRLCISSPPWSFGSHRISHFASWYYLLRSSLCQKNLEQK